MANAITILSRDDRWQRVLAYDLFAEALITRASPPWHGDDAPKETKVGHWTAEDTVRTVAWLAREYGLVLYPSQVNDALLVVARRAESHPVRDWLRSLRWDDKRRIDRLFIDYFGAADTQYSAAVSAKFMISALARVESPGCKVDTMPILEGEQGIGKSSGLRALAGDEWFIEFREDLSGKDAMQVLRRKWIAEIPELDSFNRSEAAAIKSFLSRQVDTYRPSYGAGARDFARQVVFTGSTNAETYLRDETGNRRFWPIRCGKVDLAAIRRDRELLWAEAHHRYHAGELWYVTDASLAKDFESEQQDRFQADPWTQPVAAWLRNPTLHAKGVTTHEVLVGALNFAASHVDRREESRVGAVLRHLKWKARQRTENGVRVRRYHPNGLCGVVQGCADDDSENTPDNRIAQPSQPKQGVRGL